MLIGSRVVLRVFSDSCTCFGVGVCPMFGMSEATCVVVRVCDTKTREMLGESLGISYVGATGLSTTYSGQEAPHCCLSVS